MARAGELVAETIALVGEHLEPGVTTAELDRLAEEFIRSQGGVPTSKGYRGYPARPLHLAERRWSCTASPARTTCARGRHRLDRPRGHARRLRRRLGLHVPGRRDRRRRPSGCSRSARRRSPPGSSRPGVGNRLSDISHAVQTVDRGGRLLGRPQPRRPRRRPLVPRGPADPELRPARAGARAARGDDARDRADDQRGRPGRRRPRRRVVDLDRRRLAFRPFRAHRRGHRGRALTNPATRFADDRPARRLRGGCYDRARCGGGSLCGCPSRKRRSRSKARSSRRSRARCSGCRGGQASSPRSQDARTIRTSPVTA